MLTKEGVRYVQQRWKRIQDQTIGEAQNDIHTLIDSLEEAIERIQELENRG